MSMMEDTILDTTIKQIYKRDVFTNGHTQR